MPLRGKPPETIEKRLKALWFGAPGSGKTTGAIQFPRPYLIDTEKGAENDEYVDLLKKSGGLYFFTADFEELLVEVTTLLTEKHEFRTLIIDPLTVVYNDLCDKSAKALATREDPSGTAYGRHKAVADRKLKHLLNLLLRLDMNVIITSHAKGEWKNGQPTGTDTFDCYNKLDYLFDLVLMIQKRGTERVGIVKKSRIKTFPEADLFPFSYDSIADRYGRDILERKAKVQVLASAEQVGQLKHLCEVLKVPAEVQDKWLDKAQAETFEEMPAEAAAKCIQHLQNQINNPKTAAA